MGEMSELQKWEYKVLADNPSNKVLNDFGAEGWEVVAVVGDLFAQMVYLKRPISRS